MIRPQACRWAWLGLILLHLSWTAWLHPPDRLSIPAALTLILLPLLAPAPWIWRLRPKALILGGGILVFHFSYAVAEAWVNPQVRLAACLQILLVGTYFMGLVSRFRQISPG